MRHYLFVGDRHEVLGVWEVEDELSATKLSLKLSLMYPGCSTFFEHATDFESFKRGFADFNFDGLEPDNGDNLRGDSLR
jgi:hypothetical protein